MNKIIGVHIIGPFASELINEASTLISLEATADEMCDIIHAHPTCAEALMEAAADALGRATHLPKRE